MCGGVRSHHSVFFGPTTGAKRHGSNFLGTLSTRLAEWNQVAAQAKYTFLKKQLMRFASSASQSGLYPEVTR